MRSSRTQLHDFGQKIEGARKDLYFSDADRRRLGLVSTRDSIWKLPTKAKWPDCIANQCGGDRFLAYWGKMVHDSIEAKIPSNMSNEHYRDTIWCVKQMVESLKPFEWEESVSLWRNDNVWYDRIFKRTHRGAKFTIFEVLNTNKFENFKERMDLDGFGYPEGIAALMARKASLHIYVIGKDCHVDPKTSFLGNLAVRSNPSINPIGLKFVDKDHALQAEDGDLFVIRRHINGLSTEGTTLGIFKNEEQLDCYLDTLEISQSKGKTQKTKFRSTPLSTIRRKGDIILGEPDDNMLEHFFIDITEEDFQHFYPLRGVQYGKYTKDGGYRWDISNMAFEAFDDLAKVLDITREDVTLGYKLSLAFGARGHGGAAAHFEPKYNVINLTKENGPGSLAHEWAHALDFYFGRLMPNGPQLFGSEHIWQKQCFSELRDLYHFIQCEMPDYMQGSILMDQSYSKEGLGYWHSPVEMFARAFATFIIDALHENDALDDFLSFQVDKDYRRKDKNGSYYYGVPQGKERENCNEAFKLAFKAAKKHGIFKSYVSLDSKKYFGNRLPVKYRTHKKTYRKIIIDQKPAKPVAFKDEMMDFGRLGKLAQIAIF